MRHTPATFAFMLITHCARREVNRAGSDDSASGDRSGASEAAAGGAAAVGGAAVGEPRAYAARRRACMTEARWRRPTKAEWSVGSGRGAQNRSQCTSTANASLVSRRESLGAGGSPHRWSRR